MFLKSIIINVVYANYQYLIYLLPVILSLGVYRIVMKRIRYKLMGPLLCANHDKLFDKGLISFDENGNIIISSKLSNMDKILSNIQNDNK